MTESDVAKPSKKLQVYFACDVQQCAEEVTYPADMLYWCAEEKVFMCENCMSQYGWDRRETFSLREYLLKIDAPIRGFL